MAHIKRLGKSSIVLSSILLLLFLLIALLSMFRPMIAGYIMQHSQQKTGLIQFISWFNVLLLLNGGILILYLVRAVLYTRLELKLLSYLQTLVMKKLFKLPIDFFDQYTTGDLVHRVLWINSLSQLLGSNQMGLFLSFLSLLISFSVMLYFNWQLTLIVFSLILLCTAIALFSALRLLPRLEQHADGIGKAYGFLLQVLNGMARIKLFARQSHIETTWELMYGHTRTQLHNTYIRGILGYAFFNSIPLLILFIVFVLSTLQDTNVFATHFIIFFCGLCSLLASIVVFYINAGSIVDALIAYRRIQPIFLAATEQNSEITERRIPESLEHIHISNVSFSYPNSERLILQGVTCQIIQGQHVALVGLSGSGKSTLIKLILGFYTPQQGQIVINGHLLHHIDLLKFRAKIGIALQDGQLINGTILENIMSHFEATEEEVWNVLTTLGCKEWITSLPKGIHTLVSQQLNLLSAGQKQMVLLARALIGNPQLLILDEATNSLDDATQELITEKINSLAMTRITIAHRLSSIKRVDKIFVLEQGVIVEEGTYEQLIRQKGFFYQLVSCS